MHVAVAGGTGLIGRLVVRRLTAAGHEPIVLSRSTGVDLMRPGATAGRLTGADAVVDVTSTGTLSTRRAVAFFGAVTRNLLAEAERAGVGHHLALSIVGIDRAPSGYYAGKVEQERLVRSSTVPWTIVRATQFHEFAGQLLDRGRLGPVSVVPQMLSAPVAAAEVADLIVELVETGPRSDTIEISGPAHEVIADLGRRLLRARGSRRVVLAVPLPGRAGRAMRRGGCLPTRPGLVGRQTFAQWLAARAR